VHQHPALFPDLTVAENVFIGQQPRRGGRSIGRSCFSGPPIFLPTNVDFP
jgi:ABC-type sugar transport system ATPase subunit